MDLHRVGLISTRLHYFETVAELGSVREAAERLHVSPSSISRLIGLLEADLQIQLFTRFKQRLHLTEAGEQLLHHARGSQDELARGHAILDDLKGLRRGTVRLAVVESVARGPLPELLVQFWKHYPDIEVDIQVTNATDAARAVADARADLAIAFDVALPPETRRMASADLQLGALMPPDHRLARRESVSVSDLRDEPLLRSDSSLGLGSAIADAAEETGAAPRVRARINSIGLMIDLATCGCGIAIQTRVGAEQELLHGDLVFVPLRSAEPLPPRKLLLIARSRAHLTVSGKALAELLAHNIKTLLR